ncbi:MAG: butyrate kinase [Clostridia bacterium]|nr:butyrate kinase [Clostridia bacterium]
MSYRIFVINPGSTSTKLAYFEDDKKLFETNVFHDSSELAKFPTINAQLPYRKKVIMEFLKENNLDLHGIDAVVGRGGASYACLSGVYEITDLLLNDTIEAKSGVVHPSSLGPQLAREVQAEFGGRAFIVDCPMSDEFEEIARITGLKGLYRMSHLHVLNQKATARVFCKENGLKYEDSNLIVCHIDGGMSFAAHRKGKMIDGTDGAGGEGSFTPTRAGNLDSLDFTDYLRNNGIDLKDARKHVTQSGGFVSHFGTSNADTVHDMVKSGDEYAKLVWEAMAYNICKQIGIMATVLEGEIDAIVLGGGLLRFDDLCELIEKRVKWIAPVHFYPGEFEHEAMAEGALRVLRGEEELKVYTGKPIWSGLDK